MVKIAITINETYEHEGHDIGILTSIGDNWEEYHGDGKNKPKGYDDSPMCRTWICEVDKNEIKTNISFCFCNLYMKRAIFYNEKLINKEETLRDLRKYNESKEDKLDNPESITVDYWINVSSK
ncbi:MAG: hypothetical protein K6F04_02685 [bacterium]|nr:hypothetical protein [bacterium]